MIEFNCSRENIAKTLTDNLLDRNKHILRLAQFIDSATECTTYAVDGTWGSGKTVLNQLATLWAACTGKTEFVTLIASNASRAASLMEDLKTWLETNDDLCDDFPEICVPARKLERVVHRQKGQRYHNVPTRIEWGAKRIVFPTIEGSKASGVAIACAGMEGSEIRGLSFTRSDGRKIRPTLVLVDDPQTRESAVSKTQCDYREAIIKA
ncbi:MAG: hypothetical protein HUJ54_11590, partial [Erysipelotrichaceae bacterium]|nr:hypothetical protein [Erysipelotrichaceae bacterium]